MKIKDAFENIHPDEALIRDTKAKMLEAARFVQKEDRRRRNKRRLTAGLSAAAALLIAGTGFSYAYMRMPVSTLYLDINPSYKLSLDRRSRVTEAVSLNEDAEQLLDTADLKGITAEEAVDRIMDSADRAGYFPEDVVSVVSLAMPENDSGLSLLDNCSRTLEDRYDLVAVYTSSLSRETVAAANGLDMSPGKYELVSMVSELDGEADLEELKSASVTSLFDRLDGLTAEQSSTAALRTQAKISHVSERRLANAPEKPAEPAREDGTPEGTPAPSQENGPAAVPSPEVPQATAGPDAPAASAQAPASTPEQPSPRNTGEQGLPAASPQAPSGVPEPAVSAPAESAEPNPPRQAPATSAADRQEAAQPPSGSAVTENTPAAPGTAETEQNSSPSQPETAPQPIGADALPAEGSAVSPVQSPAAQGQAPAVPAESAAQDPGTPARQEGQVENSSFSGPGRQESAPSGANPSNGGPGR